MGGLMRNNAACCYSIISHWVNRAKSSTLCIGRTMRATTHRRISRHVPDHSSAGLFRMIVTGEAAQVALCPRLGLDGAPMPLPAHLRCRSK
jgi:hypothetical protein